MYTCVCMHVCMYVCMYMCVYIHLYNAYVYVGIKGHFRYIDLYVTMYMYIPNNVGVYVYIYLSMYIYIYICVVENCKYYGDYSYCACLCVYVCVCVYIYICIYIYICVCVCVHVHICIQMHACVHANRRTDRQTYIYCFCIHRRHVKLRPRLSVTRSSAPPVALLIAPEIRFETSRLV